MKLNAALLLQWTNAIISVTCCYEEHLKQKHAESRFLLQYLSFVYEWRQNDLAPVVEKVDNAIHRINHYPLDIAIGFAITYPVDSDLSGG